MVLYLNILVKNSSSVVEERTEKRTGPELLSEITWRAPVTHGSYGQVR